MIACDGMWEVKSNEEAVGWVHENIYSGKFRQNKPNMTGLVEGVGNLVDSCWARDRFA